MNTLMISSLVQQVLLFTDAAARHCVKACQGSALYKEATSQYGVEAALLAWAQRETLLDEQQ